MQVREATASATPAGALAGTRWWLVPLGLFAASRLVQAALLRLAAGDQLPASQAQTFYVPLVTGRSYLDLVGSWDGQWYAQIARHGYPASFTPTPGGRLQSEWAFYPLYPTLVAGLLVLGLGYGLAASLVSLAAGAAAMVVLFDLVRTHAGGYAATLAVAAMSFFPASLVLQTGYAESLALLCALLGLWSLRERRYGLLVAAGVALALTRPIAPALVAVAAWHLLSRWRAGERDLGRGVAATTAVAVACALWPLATALGPGSYTELQRAFVARDDEAGSWLWRAVTLSPPAVAVLVAIAVGALLALTLRRSARLWGPELRAWGLAYPLFVLAVTEPGSSIVRHLMMAVVLAWPLPEAGRVLVSRRARLLVLGLVVLGGSALSFLWIDAFFVFDSPGTLWP